MGKKSGTDNVTIWAERLGIELDEDQTSEVLMRVKKRAIELKRTLTEDEFREIANSVRSGTNDWTSRI